MFWITSLGELKGFKCVRTHNGYGGNAWFELECERGPWYFELEYGQVASGSVVLRREIGDKDWTYAFHDIRLLAALMPLIADHDLDPHTMGSRLHEGDRFSLFEKEDDAWSVVEGYAYLLNLDVLEHAHACVEWVDQNLRPVGRCESARNMAKLWMLQAICAKAYAERLKDREHSLYSSEVQAIEVILTRQLRNGHHHALLDGDGSCWIDSDAFEYLLDLGKVMEIAARSINSHVDRKDFTPNRQKVEAYEQMLDRDRLDELAKRSDYAEDLRMRAEMIRKSAENGYQYPVEWVRPYRPSLFPKTCVWTWKR